MIGIKRGLLILAGTVLGAALCRAQVDLHYMDNRTVSWSEAIAMYESLDEQYGEAKLVEAGMSDAGLPVHLFIISGKGIFSPEEAREAGMGILFINNGIHPGEPCGIDASLELASGLLSGKDAYSRFLENTVVVIVPVFNIGGALNRSRFHRANQNGPLEHGFRGNARNLDLNRDFIKLDSRNTRTMTMVLRRWKPDIFVDTHTSNGADYPYAITLINSHEQRHETSQARFMEEHLKPWIFQAMKETPYEMCPYVWSYRGTPENGIVGFMDYPRYTSGYASLYNSLAFTVETHMFKPFSDRVLSTWHLLREFLRFSSLFREEIAEAKQKAWQEKMSRDSFVLQWERDTTRFDLLTFRGYTAKTKTGAASGLPQTWYDRDDPWEREIPYYRYFRPTAAATVPGFYILPYAWGEVAHRLRLNGVSMDTLKADTLLQVQVSYIESFQTYNSPYNGHFPHYGVVTRDTLETLVCRKGDLLIPLDQEAREYLVQVLEPGGNDSFFAWNFFDEILFRNEYFSPYIFEDTARSLLEEDPELENALESRKKEDPGFAESAYAQLRFIYERSPWSEPTYRRYPVYRLSGGSSSRE